MKRQKSDQVLVKAGFHPALLFSQGIDALAIGKESMGEYQTHTPTASPLR